LRHFTVPGFWASYQILPKRIQTLADKNFELLKSNPLHPSLHLKKVGKFWSARIGKNYRTLGTEVPEGIVWFWIGNHDSYEKLISR
jgi:hypothetical protein